MVVHEILELEKGDLFRVDSHNKTLRVHDVSDAAPIVLDAYDSDGAHWPVARVDDTWYIGYSQLTPEDQQVRAKEFNSVEIVAETQQAELHNFA
jgi:hypothetical protein